MKIKTTIKEHKPVWTAFLSSRLTKWEGKEVLLEIKLLKNIRSNNANRYYFATLNFLCKELGYTDTDDLHRLFKGMFLPKREVTLNGKKYYLAGSTATLTTSEFMEYIEKIRIEMAQIGIELPDAEAYKRGMDEPIFYSDLNKSNKEI